PARRAPPAGAPRGLCRGDALLPRRLARASRGPRRLRHRVPAPPASRADAGDAALEADALPARARVAPAGLAARWGGGAMKAAVMRGIGEPLRIEELRLDAPAPREVVVRTAATGVCHSDLHVIEGSLPSPLPTVLGHEPAGVVESVGRDVRQVEPGDH